jgi:hypothetical protein
MKMYIYAMAIPKREAKIKINSYADIIQRHVIECVVYSDTPSFHHWITELASWFYKVSSIKCKSRLSESDYMEALFAGYGDEISDARLALEEYHDSRIRQANYPDFEITAELSSKLFKAYTTLINTTIPLLISKSAILAEDWEIILSEILR